MSLTLYQEIFPEFERPAQKLEAITQGFNIRYRKVNCKGKTHGKFTKKLGFVCNNASLQLHEKQSTMYFARNTTTHYSPNWC